jgi:hypothetical protein
MNGGPDGANGGPYRIARTIGGLVLLGTAALVWATRLPGDVDTGQLALLVGTGGVLLGVDVVKRFVK